MLPDLPKNMPNMEILIQEFETGFRSISASCRDTAAKSTLSDGNFVKKIVEAYESSVRTSKENSQLERTKERSDFSNTLDVAKKRKNLEKNDSDPALYSVASTKGRSNFKKKSKIFSTPFEAREIEDDLTILNQYHSKGDVKTETLPGFPPKINMYSSMSEPSMNVQPGPSKKSEIWNLKKRNKKSEDKTKKDKLMICSSSLMDIEDKDLDSEDPLDDILSSCDSSSNNSYRNLQADLYCFKDEQRQFELSSNSLSSSKSSLGTSHNNMLSINNDDGSLFQDLSFQDAIVTSCKDIPEDRENLRDSELVSSSNFDRKSPQVIGASLNEDRPIKINSDDCATWISALGEKLSQKKSLKKLKSTFNTKLLNCTKVWKKAAEKQPNERTSDSGFIERFLSSSSSSSSQKSWRSDLNETPPTFGTFGRAKNDGINDKSGSKSSRMVLTEVPREEFTKSDSEPSNSTSSISSRGTNISCKENHESLLSKSTMLTSSSKLTASCEYPPLRKHPYLPRNRIPKHPFVAKTKLDQTTEKESIEEKEVRCDAKEHESDTRELEPSNTSPVSQAELNSLYSKVSEWFASSRNDNCDLSR